jgi:hypothetical protein
VVGWRRATSMDAAEWLRGVGLEKYMPAFRANDIDGAVLRRLTGEDLRESVVSHRYPIKRPFTIISLPAAVDTCAALMPAFFASLVEVGCVNVYRRSKGYRASWIIHSDGFMKPRTATSPDVR